MEATLTY